VGEVVTTGNHSDILTKFLAPPLHEAHTTFLNLHNDTQDAWKQKQHNKNSSSLDEEDRNLSNNVLSYHPLNQHRNTATNVPRLRFTTPQYHRSAMEYSSPNRLLPTQQSKITPNSLEPNTTTLSNSPVISSTKQQHTLTSPIQPSFHEDMHASPPTLCHTHTTHSC
jgi:hypothetical protein